MKLCIDCYTFIDNSQFCFLHFCIVILLKFYFKESNF